MSRTVVFFILGLIMLILATIAAFEFGEEFSAKYSDNNGQMVTGIISKLLSANSNASKKISPNNDNTNTSKKDTSKNTNATVMQAKILSLDNSTQLVKEGLLEDEHFQDDEEQKNNPEEENTFVWITETPSQIKKGEKAITQTRLTIGKQISFKITGADVLKAHSMLLQNPERFVLDIQGNWAISLPPIPPTNPWLKKIRLGSHNGNTRLVFDLQKKPSVTEVKQLEKNKIEVQIQ